MSQTGDIKDSSDETANLAVYPDEGPSSGEWVDVDDVIANPTDQEVEEGNALGEGIDPDDDDDTGVDDG